MISLHGSLVNIQTKCSTGSDCKCGRSGLSPSGRGLARVAFRSAVRQSAQQCLGRETVWNSGLRPGQDDRKWYANVRPQAQRSFPAENHLFETCCRFMIRIATLWPDR